MTRIFLRLANVRNGLAFPYDNVCYFQSQYGHHKSYGYFNHDAMPLGAVIHLLQGGGLVVVDATRRHKLLSDAQKFGVPTWCGVYNRALRFPVTSPCAWWTTDMAWVVRSNIHSRIKRTYRKLAALYRCEATRPAVIGDNIILECHQGFLGDDNVRRLVRYIHGRA